MNKIKELDLFDVYQDGEETFRGVAIEDECNGFVKVIKVIEFPYLESLVGMQIVDVEVEFEIEDVICNLKEIN